MNTQEVKNKILETISTEGYYWSTPEKWDLDEEAIKQLISENKIESGRSANIRFMNEDYFYVLKGNQNNVFVKDDGKGLSWLEKGS